MHARCSQARADPRELLNTAGSAQLLGVVAIINHNCCCCCCCFRCAKFQNRDASEPLASPPSGGARQRVASRPDAGGQVRDRSKRRVCSLSARRRQPAARLSMTTLEATTCWPLACRCANSTRRRPIDDHSGRSASSGGLRRRSRRRLEAEVTCVTCVVRRRRPCQDKREISRNVFLSILRQTMSGATRDAIRARLSSSAAILSVRLSRAISYDSAPQMRLPSHRFRCSRRGLAVTSNFSESSTKATTSLSIAPLTRDVRMRRRGASSAL